MATPLNMRARMGPRSISLPRKGLATPISSVAIPKPADSVARSVANSLSRTVTKTPKAAKVQVLVTSCATKAAPTTRQPWNASGSGGRGSGHGASLKRASCSVKSAPRHGRVGQLRSSGFHSARATG